MNIAPPSIGGGFALIISVPATAITGLATGDLAQTIGLVGQPTHPDVLAVVDEAHERIKAAGRLIAAGVSYVTEDV